MKKIALLADGWKRLITYAWVRGINQFIDKYPERIEVCHYNCMGNWSDDRVFNQGEYNIFHLPDLTMFDGIILDLNNVCDEVQKQHLVDLVKESGVPAISLGCYVPEFYYVGVDNAGAIRQLMEHLRKVHDCQSFCFVGGPKNNIENEMRVEAFRCCMQEMGHVPSNQEVSYGTFEMTTGSEYFGMLAESGRKLPDAFICANDNIAAGLIDEAQKRGFLVPRDFAVTGFDNLDKAVCFNPQITTVSHQRERIGETCMELLSRIWEGHTIEQTHYIEPEITYTESCGCRFSIPIDYREFARSYIVENESRRQFEEKRIALEGCLAAATEFDQIFHLAGEYFKRLDCDGIAVVVDDRLLELQEEEVFSISGFDREHMKVVYGEYLEDGVYEPYDSYWKRIEKNLDKDVCMFTPLHYRNRTIGFTILLNGKFLYDNPYFYDIQSLLNRVLWDMYQRKCYIKANRKLDELYKRDALTGLYNRTAYFEQVDKMFEECRRKATPCMIAFFDCDNFKRINDEQGHDAGDEILKRAGNILKQFCDERGNAYRFGGDEFIIVHACESMEKAAQLVERIRDRFEKEQIAISIGSVVTDTDNNMTLQEYLNIADQAMYENKRKKKNESMVER